MDKWPRLEWLRCPMCVDVLHLDAGTVRCGRGHAFDLNRQGYLTLFPRRRPRVRGDERPMLEARSRFLASGVYQPIADAVTQALGPAAGGRGAIVDLGCGTGYYAAQAATALAIAPERLLLADLSADAVRMAIRALPGATGVVLDVHADLPIADEVADAVSDVFAPRNLPESRRILARGGRLVIVIPRSDHLEELRAAGGVIGILPDKRERLLGQLDDLVLADTALVSYRVRLEPELLADLVAMGPSAHHAVVAPDGPLEVTVSVEVLVALRP